MRIIRKFQPADLEAVLELFYNVVHTVGAKYYDQEQVKVWASSFLDRDKWLKSLTTNTTYVAEIEGQIIGFGDMTQTGYIDHLFVHKNHQGTGVALALFRRLEEEAQTLGCIELTTEASIIAKPLAERQGFEVVQKQRKIRSGVEFTNYIMRKKL